MPSASLYLRSLEFVGLHVAATYPLNVQSLPQPNRHGSTSVPGLPPDILLLPQSFSMGHIKHDCTGRLNGPRVFLNPGVSEIIARASRAC
jgi:hypothetical protein